MHVNMYLSYIQQHIFGFRSVIASELLSSWPAMAKQFIKVFPYEYQRALNQIASKPVIAIESNGNSLKSEPIMDIEEAVQDVSFEKRRLERLLDKTRYIFIIIFTRI